ncbi:MAG: DHH family phosphoesterase [Bacilli bacterium]
MKKSYNLIKIVSYLTLLLQVILILTLYLMYFYNSFDVQNLITVPFIFIFAAVFVTVDAIIMLLSVFIIERSRYKQDILTTDLFGSNIQESLDFTQLGIIVVDENQIILWENRLIESHCHELLDTNILDAFPKLRDLYGSNTSNSVIVTINDKFFNVTYMAQAGVYLFKDTTEYENLFKYSKNQAIVLGIIVIDNFNEIISTDEETSDVIASVRTKINDYFKTYGVLLRKYKNDSYFAICNYNSLLRMQDNNFEILDSIRSIEGENEINPTLSIGFAHDFPSVYKLNEMASSALDIAISRGGDQAVVSKYGSDLQFYGGKTEAIEKKNKVRVRVLADSLFSVLKQASNVLIMGHMDMDMDSLGSALGIKVMCDYLGLDSRIVYDYKLVERKTRSAFSQTFSKEEAADLIISPKDAINSVNPKTILVIVDFHRPSMALNKDLIEECSKIIVIDHHRRSEEFISNPVFSYTESSASSACELITELIYYASSNPQIVIPSAYATIMLSGIFMDTAFYSSSTSGIRTFEASMVLRKFGADNVTADEFLKDDFEEAMLISKILTGLKTPYTGIVYCTVGEELVDPVIISKVASRCVDMKDIKASFVIGRTNENEVKISARSDGSVNVQLLCEKMGGGGHFAGAAVTFKSTSCSEIETILLSNLKDYLNESRVKPGEGKEEN